MPSSLGVATIEFELSFIQIFVLYSTCKVFFPLFVNSLCFQALVTPSPPPPIKRQWLKKGVEFPPCI